MILLTQTGTVERVEGLRQWCMDRGYNANAFANASLRGNKTHGGFHGKTGLVEPASRTLFSLLLSLRSFTAIKYLLYAD